MSIFGLRPQSPQRFVPLAVPRFCSTMNLGDQIEGERLRFKFNLDAPDNIGELEALNALLKQRYREAQEYFIKVQLQEIGQKERIDNELKEMAGHLDLAED